MNICLSLESKEVVLCHILKWLNVLFAEKQHTEEMKLIKNLDIDMMALCHSHGVENAEVWEVAADTHNVRFGVMIIRDVIIRQNVL